jgi:hypothetical protein
MALATAALLDVGSARTEAARSTSRFAGAYVGADPHGWYGAWDIAISNGGRISS